MKPINSRPEGLIMLPLICEGHWTLLVLEMKLKAVRFYDSLELESQNCRTFAACIVQDLKKEGVEWLPDMLPKRVNTVKQGLLQCGFYVSFWIEEELRERRGEGRWPSGPPNIVDIRAKLLKFLENLEPTCRKVHLRMKDLMEQEQAAIAKHDAAADAAKAAGAADESSKALAELAMESMQAGTKGGIVDVEIAAEGDLETWAEQMKPFLLDAHQKDVERVKETGLGVCSTCRWTSGCRHCSWVKTVRYWRRKETLGKHLECYTKLNLS